MVKRDADKECGIDQRSKEEAAAPIDEKQMSFVSPASGSKNTLGGGFAAARVRRGNRRSGQLLGNQRRSAAAVEKEKQEKEKQEKEAAVVEKREKDVQLDSSSSFADVVVVDDHHDREEKKEQPIVAVVVEPSPVEKDEAPALAIVVDKPKQPIVVEISSSPVEVRKPTPPLATSSSQPAKRGGAHRRLAKVDDAARLGWERAQEHTFKAWLNYQLRGEPGFEDADAVDDLVEGLKSGVVLVRLLEKLTEASLGRTNKNPRLKVQMVENLSTVMRALAANGIKTVNIGGEDIYEGNKTLDLGLLWTLILRFQVAQAPTLPNGGGSSSDEEDPFALDVVLSDDDSDDDDDDDDDDEAARLAAEAEARRLREQSDAEAMRAAKNRLLEWVQRRCTPFGVQVDNFTTSFSSGSAFSALTASIDEAFDFLVEHRGDDALHNMTRSFDFNDRELGIPKLLCPEHLIEQTPDEKSVMTYVSLLYQHHGGRKAIEPREPEPEMDLHVEVQGDGLKSPVAHAQNTFGITITDRNTGLVVPSAELLNVDIVSLGADGALIAVEKRPRDDGGTDFAYRAGQDDLRVRIEFDGEEVATLDVHPKPAVVIEWEQPAGVPLALGHENRIGARFRDGDGAPLPGDECARLLRVAMSNAKSGSPPLSADAGELELRVEPARSGAPGAVDIFLTPRAGAGLFDVALDFDGKASATRQYRVAKPQLFLVDQPARIMINKLPAALDTDETRSAPLGAAIAADDGRTVVDVHIDETGSTARHVLDFELGKTGVHSVALSKRDATAYMDPVVGVTKLPGADGDGEQRYYAGEQATVTTAWSTSFPNAVLGVQGPPGSKVAAGDIIIVDKGDVDDWLRTQFMPDVAGEYQLVAISTGPGDGSPDGLHDRGAIQWLQSVEVIARKPEVAAGAGDGYSDSDSDGDGDDETRRRRRKKRKGVEVVSVTPLEKPDKGLVRVYLGTDELPRLLNIESTFKTVPVTSETTMNDLRLAVSRQILRRADKKTTKSVLRVATRDQYCIVEVSMHGVEKMAPFANLVLDTMARFKRDTAERLQKEAMAASSRRRRASGADTDGSKEAQAAVAASLLAPSDALQVPDVQAKKKKRRGGSRLVKRAGSRIGGSGSSKDDLVDGAVAASSSSSSPSSLSGESESRRQRRRDLKAHGSGRLGVVEAREQERKKASVLMHQLDGTGSWSKQAGTFKLIVRIHRGENLVRPGLGLIYLEATHKDQVKHTNKWNLSDGDPEWESNLEFSIEPGDDMDLDLQLKHTAAADESWPLGVINIPLGYLQPDMAKQAFYVLKKPGQVTTLSNRRVLITLEHHVLEIEPDSKLFFKPAPRLWLEISVKYNQLRVKPGEHVEITATVRDEKKKYALTNDLKGGDLRVHIQRPSTEDEDFIVLEPENPMPGTFVFNWTVPSAEGKYRSMLRYSGSPMQRKHAVFIVRGTKKISVGGL
jgi:Calponin homology (CH) domain